MVGAERTLTHSDIRFSQPAQWSVLVWAATVAARMPSMRRLRIWWSILIVVLGLDCSGDEGDKEILQMALSENDEEACGLVWVYI